MNLNGLAALTAMAMVFVTPALAATAKLPDGRIIQLATTRIEMTADDLAKFEATGDQMRRIKYKAQTGAKYGGENATAMIPDARTQGYGDCKSISVAFRNAMVEQGYPADAMLLAFGLTEKKTGHMVVIIRTTTGDLAFDIRTNKLTTVSGLRHVGYRFEGIESAPNKVLIGYNGEGFTAP